MRHLMKVTVFGAFFALPSCGEKTTASFSCDMKATAATLTVHTCLEYKDISDTVKNAAKTACVSNTETGVTATSGDAACSTTDLLGSCKMTDYSKKYYSGGYTADTAKTSCTDTDKGTWTAA